MHALTYITIVIEEEEVVDLGRSAGTGDTGREERWVEVR